jgi:hypothetical protein
MKYRPILYSTPMIPPLLADVKTQTRRLVKPQPHTSRPDYYADRYNQEPNWAFWLPDGKMSEPRTWRCPYGEPGDRLWVRETWCPLIPEHFHEPGKPRDFLSERYNQTRRNGAAYRADCMRFNGGKLREDSESERCRKELGYLRWTPAIHMPRWASRLTLEVTGVRVERLQAITEDEARAEGVTPFPANPEGDCWTDGKHRTAFVYLWNEINGWHPSAWDANPWVWVVSFRRVAP